MFNPIESTLEKFEQEEKQKYIEQFQGEIESMGRLLQNNAYRLSVKDLLFYGKILLLTVRQLDELKSQELSLKDKILIWLFVGI